MIVRLPLALTGLALVGATPDPGDLRRALEKPNVELRLMIEKMMNDAIAESPTPDWATGGIDIVALLEAAPGGLEGNVFLDQSDGMTVHYFGTREIMLPTLWDEATLFDEPPGPGVPLRTVASLTDRILIDATGALVREKSAFCADSLGQTRVFHPQDSALSEEEEIAMIALREMRDWLSNTDTCSVYREVAPGRYEERLFTRDGRELLWEGEGKSRYRIASFEQAQALILGDRPSE